MGCLRCGEIGVYWPGGEQYWPGEVGIYWLVDGIELLTWGRRRVTDMGRKGFTNLGDSGLLIWGRWRFTDICSDQTSMTKLSCAEEEIQHNVPPHKHNKYSLICVQSRNSWHVLKTSQYPHQNESEWQPIFECRMTSHLWVANFCRYLIIN